MLCAFTCGALAQAPQRPVHGLWVWKTGSVLAAPGSIEALREFCTAQQVNEVYVSFSSAGGASGHALLARVIQTLHRSGIRVQALLSSTDADEAGGPREKLLDHVREVIEFNQSHPAARFDGVHLDIEPQQRPENKGEGNLNYLPGLVETFRAVRKLAVGTNLSMNADIQKKLLKGDREQRRSLLSASPQLTLMLYEVGGGTIAEKEKRLRDASEDYMRMAYQDLSEADVGGRHFALMSIGLRVPDYGKLLPQMLRAVDETLRSNPHYLGWAWHSWRESPEDGSGD